MQNRKLIILLALLVFLPLTLLSWQGWKISQDTQKINDARFASLMTARLNQVDTVVQSYFEEMQLKWSLSIPQWQLDSASTRKRIESDGNIRQIFVLDPQRIRSFPPLDKDITAAEKVFVDRLASLWSDPEILFSNTFGYAQDEQIASVKKRLKTDAIIASAERKENAELASAALDSYEITISKQNTVSKENTVFKDNILSKESIAAKETIVAEELAIAAENTRPEIMASKTTEVAAMSSGVSASNTSIAQSSLKSKAVSKLAKITEKISTTNSRISSSSIPDTSPDKSPNKQGWYMWHWGNDSNLIFWQEGKDNSIVGVEMEPVRVKADLISRLPDASPEESKDFRLRLLDIAGNVVYQWGNYTIPASPNNQQQAQQRLSLSYPLSSWTLEYFGEPFSQSGTSQINTLLSFLGFALLLSALAWFLYREQTREMRLAEKRVQFVSQVSHELKTPLTNIRMYAEMLESQVDDAEQPQRYLQVITDESKRLTRMISNVLNFSREPRVHKREIDVDEVIRQSIAHFTPSFEAKNMVLNTDLKMRKFIHTDPDLLEQILNNLLSNVEKYASDGKRLDVSSELKIGSCIVRVRDYGLGISRHERKQIFKPFYRIDDKITEGVSGTGIGLTIARQQAEYLGGSLEYVDLNTGACFELTLPLGEV